MHEAEQNNISNFFVAGINYRKTQAEIRSSFAINNQQYKNILDLAPSCSVAELFILSTCNRTEIYGFAQNAAQLINLLCTQTTGDQEMFTELSYVKQGNEAVQHFFEVGAGLDSQVLGDYEIIGQIKIAVKFAKEHGFVGSFTERLVNSVLQSTKAIKNETVLSGGTVSVSFAAVQLIKRSVSSFADKKILLLGAGKIGRNTCKNLVDYLGAKNITLINRTESKAEAIAKETGVHYAPIKELASHIQSSDIILVATNSAQPLVLKCDLEGGKNKLIIDLSIPYNVEKAAAELPHIQLVHVDELSKLKDETLQKREREVPKARAIIALHKNEFISWTDMRKNAPFINAARQKLHHLHSCDFYTSASSPFAPPNNQAIQKVIKNMAVKMRTHYQPGCSYIEAINEFVNSHKN